MALYPRLIPTVLAASAATLEARAVPILINGWLDDYCRNARGDNIVETSSGNFSYLFDIGRERLIAAWGVSAGRHGGARDKSRMRGHPLGAGTLYHRGHAIPHTLGGPTDINLVPQLGSVNIGPFRQLERLAVATPGAVYFTYWIYVGGGQRPVNVEQGLLIAGTPPRIVTHPN